MKHQTLREVCKFLSGMVAAKVLVIAFLVATGLAPLALAATPFTQDSLLPAAIFNVALLIVLIYYGWHVKSPIHSPTEKNLLYLAGVVFLIVAVAHLMRLVFGWSVIIGELNVPLWVSWLGFILAAYLCYASFHFALKMRAPKSR